MELKVKDKVVGEVKDNTYYTVRRPETIFKKFGGFGISAEVLEELIASEVKNVNIIYLGIKREVFKCFTSDFYRYGQPYRDPNNPSDRQFILSIKDMVKE